MSEMRRSPRVTVSGSFRRHLAEIQVAVETLHEHGFEVLSPSDPRPIDSFGEFLFVASDKRRSIKGVQNRHLAAIAASDFLLLICPDGYVGQSAALEIGFAIARDVPVVSTTPPSDLTIRQYVEVVAPSDLLLPGHPGTGREPLLGGILLYPESTIESAHKDLEALGRILHDTTPAEHDATGPLLHRLVTALRHPSH